MKKPKLNPMLGKMLKKASPMGAGPMAPAPMPAPAPMAPRPTGNPMSNLGKIMAARKPGIV